MDLEAPRGHFAMSKIIFGYHNSVRTMGVTTGAILAESRDAAKHTTLHRMALTTKNCPAQSVNSVKIEKTCGSLTKCH